MKIDIQKTKAFLNKYPRMKNLLKKIVLSCPSLKRFVTGRYGLLQTVYAVADERIRPHPSQDEQELSPKAQKIYKEITCLKKEHR